MELPMLEIEALRLPAGERALLADRLIRSLDDESVSGVELAWGAEAEARFEAYQRGEIKAVDGVAVLNELRNRYSR